MEKLDSVSEDKMKIPKKIARLIVLLVFSAVISFGMSDVIHIFADAFIPNSTLALRVVPCRDGVVREVTIIREGKYNEIFRLFENKIVNEGDNSVLDGWEIFEGKAYDPNKLRTWILAADDAEMPTVLMSEDTDSYYSVKSPTIEKKKLTTRIATVEEGKSLIVSMPESPDSFFVVTRDIESGFLEMSVNGRKPQIITCYVKNDRISDAVRIYPFVNTGEKSGTTVYRTAGFIVSTLIWCFVLNELTRNVRFGREEKENNIT